MSLSSTRLSVGYFDATISNRMAVAVALNSDMAAIEVLPSALDLRSILAPIGYVCRRLFHSGLRQGLLRIDPRQRDVPARDKRQWVIVLPRGHVGY